MLSISKEVFDLQERLLYEKENIEGDANAEANTNAEVNVNADGGEESPECLMPEILGMLEELLNQDQFEIADEDVLQECASENQNEHRRRDIRIVFLMNDAVESFLILKNCRMTGCYLRDYEGELKAELSLTKQNTERLSPTRRGPTRRGPAKQYVLVVHQGANIISFFFENLEKEIHLYNYARLGHFWVKGYEYLRQLEYHLAILRDKRDYLGEEYCNDAELQLAVLTEFPPLNYCCYPAAPPRYVVPSYPKWQVSKAAMKEIKALAEKAGDHSMLRWLWLYEKWPSKTIARRIAAMFHREKHANLTDLLIGELAEAAAEYPDRDITMERASHLQQELAREPELQQALDRRPELQKALDRKQELERAGLRVEVVYHL